MSMQSCCNTLSAFPNSVHRPPLQVTQLRYLQFSRHPAPQKNSIPKLPFALAAQMSAFKGEKRS